jgi:hypothetical protein
VGAAFKRLPYFLGAFRVHERQKSQTEINSVGMQECQLLRERELGERFNEKQLSVKVVLCQARALCYAALMKLGLRW